jgi:hypothetical protein
MATRIGLLPVVFGVLIGTLYAWFGGYTDFQVRILHESENAYAPKELPMRHLFPFILLFGAVSLVSGCGTLDMVFQDRYSENAPTETKVLKRPWFDRDNPTQLEPVYCYKTLVELECFDKARAGDERPAVWTYKPVQK